MTKYFKEALFYSIFEYFLIITPIGIYVFLEAIQKNSLDFFFQSPEWAIATIFLSLVGISIFIREISESGKKILHPFFGILALSNVIIVVCAVLNSYLSMFAIHEKGGDSNSLLWFRLVLFILISILFFIAVISSRAYKLKQKNA